MMLTLECLAIREKYPDKFKAPFFYMMHLVKNGEHLPYSWYEGRNSFALHGTKFIIALVHVRFLPGYLADRTKQDFITLNRKHVFGFSYYYKICNDVLKWYLNEIVPRQEEVFFWVAEKGVKKRTAPYHSSLKPLRPYERKNPAFRLDPWEVRIHDKILKERANSILLACKACDGALLKKKHNQNKCPYCRQTLEVYWRGAKLYQVRLPRRHEHPDGKDWEINDGFPVMDKETVRWMEWNKTHYHEGHGEKIFLDEFMKPFKEKGFGPFCVHIRYISEHEMGWHVTPNDPRKIKADPVLNSDGTLSKREIRAVLPIPQSVVRIDGPLSERLEKGALDVERVENYWAAKKQRAVERKARLKVIPGEIVSFWKRHHVLVEDVVNDEEKAILKLVVDGISIRVKTRRNNAEESHNIKMIYVQDGYGFTIQEYNLVPDEDRLLLSFLEAHLDTLTPNGLLPLVEIAKKTKNRGLDQLVIPEIKSRDNLHEQEPVLACAGCSVMPLRYQTDQESVDQLSSTTCPYCGQQARLILRKPQTLKVKPDPGSAPQRGYLSLERWRQERPLAIGIEYYGKHVNVPLSKKQRLHLLVSLQERFPRLGVGPLKLRLTYRYRMIEHAITARPVIEAVELGTPTDPFNWRPDFILPEDSHGS